MEHENFRAWLYGSYVAQAVASVLSKRARYPKQPRGTTKALSGEEQFRLWVDEYNSRWESKHGSS